MRTPWILLALCLAGSGCVVGRATGSLYEVPRERATECQDICTKLDLQMSAVVIILNTTGCVCEPKGARAAAPPAAGVSSLSGAAPAAASRPASGGAAVAAAQVIAARAVQQGRLGQ
jgi:hypothetical protein